MSASLRDRAIIVTGAGQGLGRAYARRIAAEGATVVIAEINTDNADRVAAEIAGDGARRMSGCSTSAIPTHAESSPTTSGRSSAPFTDL